jgi:hypothetical protein
MKNASKKPVARQTKAKVAAAKSVLFDVLNVAGDAYYLLAERIPIDDAVKLVKEYARQDEYYTPLILPSDVPVSEGLAPIDDHEWRQVDIDLDYKIFTENVKELKTNRDEFELEKRKNYVWKLQEEVNDLHRKLRETSKQEAVDKAYLKELDKEAPKLVS